MPPRPSLQSLLLIAASSSSSAAAGDSGLLLAARRHFPAAFAAAGGHRIRLLHSFYGGRLPRPVELACCFGTAPAAVPVVPRSRNVGSIDKTRACEERIGQLVVKLEDKGIRIKQWRLGAFNRTLCPVCKGGFNKEQSLNVFIRNDGLNARWTCFRANCGWKGNAQADGDSKVYQAKKGTGNGSDAGNRTDAGKETSCEERIGQLVVKLEDKGIRIKQWRIGAFNRTLCPVCKGGFNKEQSLSVFIRNDGLNARWTCFRANCGWKGNAQPDGDSNVYQEKKDTGNGSDAGKETVQQFKANHAVKVYRKLCEEDLRLEPLCDELVTYFSERMISPETLRRNNVSQRKWNDKIVIAFTYRRDKVLVGCKYREISKKYTQERNTEKILYGLDDIKQARVVIIVEGEIDKLSMEEAGYRNCVSVPDGAPPQVSNKLPDKDHDTKYRYLWNCKGYLDSASKIILATDADPPGQALAEELARRLGNERCWRVTWPRKNETEFCKDANEVLMFLGPKALKEVIEGAELYRIRGLFNFRDFFSEIDSYYSRNSWR